MSNGECMRFAIYFLPEANNPLAALGACWLGRDIHGGHRLRQPRVEGIDPERLSTLTRDPRRYGFHATLKAPFHLSGDASMIDLIDRFEAFADGQAAAKAPGLTVARLGTFLALLPSKPAPELEQLAAAAVQGFDGLRAPASADEIARRRTETLTSRQRELLENWGYPYVFEEYRFHMTLTGRLDEAVECEAVAAAARSFFAPVLSRELRLETIALCVEPSPKAPFRLERLCRLAGVPASAF